MARACENIGAHSRVPVSRTKKIWIGAVRDTCAFARTGLTNNPSQGYVKILARIRAYRYLEAKKSGWVLENIGAHSRVPVSRSKKIWIGA